MQRVLKLRGDQERRRFFVGVTVDASCTTVAAPIVAATGRGLEARFETASHVIESVPTETTAEFDRLTRGEFRHLMDAMALAAQLAEVEAAAIGRLAALECHAWPRVLLAGVTDPGLWRRDIHPPEYQSLCDSTRLAELTGLNIVDAFPARDVVLEGRGGPLDAIPLWLLLHHGQANRLVVEFLPSPRAMYLPASRDESGANHVEIYEPESETVILDWLHDCLRRGGEGAEVADRDAPSEALSVDELVLLDDQPPLALQAQLAKIRVLDEASLGISHAALPAACAALLAMLHIDQVPSNLPILTAAAAPRVLGRLTPGSAHAWNRLLRDLAFSRPLITPLRAAV